MIAVNQFYLDTDMLKQIFLTLAFPIVRLVLLVVNLSKNKYFKLSLASLIINLGVIIFMFYSIYLAI